MPFYNEELIEEETNVDASKSEGNDEESQPEDKNEESPKPKRPRPNPEKSADGEGKPRPKRPVKPGQGAPGARPPRPQKRQINDKDHKFEQGLKVVKQAEDEEAPKKKRKKPVPKRRKPKINIEELKPEIALVTRLKKKKSIEIKQFKKLMKQKGTPVSPKHLKRIKKGLEVPRYKVKPQYGLTYEIVEKRAGDGLANFVITSVAKTYKRIVFTNVFTFFNLITLGIAGWLISVGAWTDLMFAVIVLANISIGIYQEIKAKLTMERMSILSTNTVFVMRQGEKQEVLVTEVVLDDIVLLEPGYQIPTDSILVEGDVEVNESMLTGESDAVVKKPGDILYGGSYIVSGIAKAQVEHIGKENYIEKLTNQVKRPKKPKSELLKSLNLIVSVMSVVIVFIGVLLFYIQYIIHDSVYRDAVRSTAGAMTGMIPAGLFLVSSMALYIGVVKLADFNVLVRELYCIEMLAKINVLCLDKTGTITDGTMQVKNVIEYKSVPGLTTRCIISAMLNSLNERNQTSIALESKFGLGKRIKHNALMPFNSARKYSAVEFAKYGTFVLGAPEIVLRHNYQLIQKDAEKYSKLGVRLLLIAHTTSRIVDDEVDLTTLSPVSIILIEDNIRPDAIDTIAYFKRSGVNVKVISGDNPMTVAKVSERAGIDNANEYISLDGLKEQEVIDAADKYTVFGRVSPAQKSLLVKTLKSQGKYVAMTGDGVNDILALKEADCSIAVASGSDAARSVSHLVLLDSNFSSMPRVVSEGRRVINNIAKVATLFLTRTIFSLLLAIQAIQNQGVYPILSVQFLMIEILVISIPSLILVLEPNNAKLEGKFLTKIIKDALPGAVAILIISAIVFALATPLNLNTRQSSTIIALVATFALFMVLYELSFPLNKVRKNLFTAMFTTFLFLTLVFPRIFDFAPLLNIGSYEDQFLETVVRTHTPHVTQSRDNFIVIDGIVTNNTFSPSNANDTNVRINEQGKIETRGVTTNHEVSLPQTLSNHIENEFLVLDAFDTGVRRFADVNSRVTLTAEGRVVLEVNYDGGNRSVTQMNHFLMRNGRPFNVMPTIGISQGNLVVNNILTDIRFEGTISDIIARLEFDSENSELNRYLVLINDERVLGTADYPTGLAVYVPVLSTIGDVGELPSYPADSFAPVMNYAVGGHVTKINEDRHNIDLNTLEIEANGEVLVNGVDSGVNFMPRVTTSTAGFWVVDGLLTYYAVGSDDRRQVSFRYEEINSAFRLIINGNQTHILIEVEIQTGGVVPTLPLPQTLLLLLLCAISLPLIRILKKVVPVSNHYYKVVRELIRKEKE